MVIDQGPNEGNRSGPHGGYALRSAVARDEGQVLCDLDCVDARRIEVLADVEPGDELTFFYPSTEWDMAAPFECSCGAPGCRGRIAGARHIPRDVLRGYWLARHIRELSEQAARA